ncbi:MAG: AraC family transcriptional regulator, partial [Gammaproteobacteria bacterium]|nr:AraC family transcriptional regulator [Gammaproteobacteria bacterium]
MKLWRLNTESFPETGRHRAWRDAMNRLCLPVGELPPDLGFRGSVSCRESPLGIEFAVVDASPHEISGKYMEQPAAMWLVLLLQGRAQLIHDGRCVELERDDIAYGPCRTEATLRFPTDF